MEASRMPMPPRPAEFCEALLAFLIAETAAQGRALILTEQLSRALIGCRQAEVEAANAALQSWELEHRMLATRQAELAADWESLGQGPGLAMSQVMGWLEKLGDPIDARWRLAEAAGELQDLLKRIGEQSELNRLLIEQHAEVLHGTWVAIAHAVQGAPTEPGYDARGASTTSTLGAALLDARG